MNSNDISNATRGQAWTPVRAALVLIVLCGGVYPVVMTLLGGALFPHQATGSIIRVDGKAVGSDLVGQPFTSAGYFYGRPSAAGHDPFSLAGSNWAPSNPDLTARVRTQAQQIAAAEGVSAQDIPIDLLAASGSGIDPHISPAAARFQAARVAAARNISKREMRALIEAHTDYPVLGVLGQPAVHVLRLNLALDRRAAN